jgi:hypothetical protein
MTIELLQMAKAGLSGLNTDLPPWDLPPENLTDGNNFRVSDAAILAHNGWSQAPNITSIGTPTRMATVFTGTDDIYLVGGANEVITYDGAVSNTLKHWTTALVDAHAWSFAMLGAIPIINHPERGILYWYPVSPSVPLAYLPFSTTPARTWEQSVLKKSGKVIRAHKNWLFLLNLTEDVNGITTQFPDAYRWSHPAEINKAPVTWDETDRNFLAGMASIGGNSGHIVDGLSLRDSFIIYSDNAINVLEQTGDVFVWRRRELTQSIGLLSKDCLVEVNGKHFAITASDIVLIDGYSVTSLLHNRIRKHFISRLSSTQYRKSFAVSNTAMKEVWFCIPSEDSAYVSIAYVYNWKDDSWAIRDLPFGTTHMSYGALTGGVTTWAALQATVPQTPWTSMTKPWGASNNSPFAKTLVGLDILNHMYNIDARDAASRDTYIERTNFAILGHKQVTTITKVYPHIRGVAPVRITLGSHDYAGSTVRWKPPIIFNPATDRKVDVLTTGALHAWRIESIDASYFEFSGLDIEYAQAGVR